jgi:hypothetical protein
MTKPGKPSMSDLAKNKREMFDGMRACHESEIHHANHAITMLLAIAAAVGAVVLALKVRIRHKAEQRYGSKIFGNS